MEMEHYQSRGQLNVSLDLDGWLGFWVAVWFAFCVCVCVSRLDVWVMGARCVDGKPWSA